MRKLWLLLFLLLVEPWDARCQLATTPMQGSAAAGDTGSHTFNTLVFKGVKITWNAGTTARYMMVFDGTAVPSNGTPTVCTTTQAAKCLAYCTYVPASTQAPGVFVLDFTEHPFFVKNAVTV